METNVKINQLINDRSICREDFFFSYFLLFLWPLKINRILYFQPRLWRKTLRRPARCLLKLSVEPDGSILSSWARPSVVVYSDRSAKVLSYRLLEEKMGPSAVALQLILMMKKSLHQHLHAEMGEREKKRQEKNNQSLKSCNISHTFVSR